VSVALRSELDLCIDALWTAAAERRAIEPLSSTYPELTVEDAYAVQSAVVERRLAVGRVIRGRKVGLTSAAMQQALGVHEPDFGVLLDDMLVDDGDAIELDALLQPKVEGEIAFVLQDDLEGPGVTAYDALRATAGVLACIEVIDSRIADWRIGLVDTVADNASSALVVPAGKLVSPAGSTCACSGWPSTATASSSTRARVRRCSVIRRVASRGSRTSSHSSATVCAPAISCSRARCTRRWPSSPGMCSARSSTGSGR